MAASLIIEQEQGTYVGAPRCMHQGYYAGDFSVQPTPPNGFQLATNNVNCMTDLRARP
jgi:hypothetical protein